MDTAGLMGFCKWAKSQQFFFFFTCQIRDISLEEELEQVMEEEKKMLTWCIDPSGCFHLTWDQGK